MAFPHHFEAGRRFNNFVSELGVYVAYSSLAPAILIRSFPIFILDVIGVLQLRSDTLGRPVSRIYSGNSLLYFVWSARRCHLRKWCNVMWDLYLLRYINRLAGKTGHQKLMGTSSRAFTTLSVDFTCSPS